VIAGTATPGAWVDTSWKLTPSVLSALKQAGKVGVMRYVPLPGNASAGDISGGEMADILVADLELLLVQHVRRPPWLPQAYSGLLDGQAAADSARAVGYPPGAHVFLDLEGAAGQPSDAEKWTNDWAAAVKCEGYLAGLYVGYSALLSPLELYALPDFDCYWSDAGPRQVATRGFAIKQGAEVTIGGVTFDLDEVRQDLLGGLPVAARA